MAYTYVLMSTMLCVIVPSGNTSMDLELSFIMANMALAQSTSFIYDPFVGSGKLTCYTLIIYVIRNISVKV